METISTRTKSLLFGTTPEFLLRHAKSKSLLDYAMDRNPAVPPLLLGWEGTRTGRGTNTLISIGRSTEANDYAIENRKYWLECEGSLEWLEKEYVTHPRATVPKINEEGRRLLSEGNYILDHVMGTTENEKNPRKTNKRVRKAVKCFEEFLKIAESSDSYLEARVDGLYRLALCHKTMDNPQKALIYLNQALEHQTILRQEKDMHKEILYQSASCKEELEDYDGALQDYKQVFDKFGCFSTGFEGVKRIENKMGRKSFVIPSSLEGKYPVPSQESLDEQERIRETARYALGVGNPNNTVAAKQERCFHCKRGGIKLKHCALCQTDAVMYCSKECQTKSWKMNHKYLCVGSKHRLEGGCRVAVEGLEKAPQYNGKVGNVVSYAETKERFIVELSEQNKKLLLKPQNLKRQNSN